MLASYARVFNTVEGNTTFYHVPTKSTVASWENALSESNCTISFKLPSVVTHQRQPDVKVLRKFLETIRPLRSHLGPFLLQFPHWAGPDFLRNFSPLFEEVAEFGAAVVEVRNTVFFEQSEVLEPLLNHFGFGCVMLDSQPLFQGDLAHPEVAAAVHEKPDVPVLETIFNDKAFVRLILHPDGNNQPWIDFWVYKTLSWIAKGIEPIIMIHCPNNQHCPKFALDFHTQLIGAADFNIPPLPNWPVPQQGSLL